MISHATEDLLLLDACMSDPVETQLSSRWKGSFLLVVGLLRCTHATKNTLECPWYLRSQGRPKFLFFRDFIHQGLRKQGGVSRGSKLAKHWSVFVWQCETISWVLEGSCENIFVCNYFMIHAEYTIEDSGVFSCKLSLGNYLCCVWFDSSLLHVIGDCVFNSTKYL